MDLTPELFRYVLTVLLTVLTGMVGLSVSLQAYFFRQLLQLQSRFIALETEHNVYHRGGGDVSLCNQVPD
jgi:hypothetical protein